MDLQLLIPAMIAGATTVGPEIGKIIGTEIVKETTKDAYRKLKSLLGRVCGRKAERAAGKVEADPASEAAQAELVAAVETIPQEDASEVEALLATLIDALGNDPAARKAATAGHIKLDIDVGGNITLERIQGATGLDVRAKAKGDFSLRDLAMGKGSPEGN